MSDRVMRRIVGGFLITFEGIGGSGKSTLARLLREHLAQVGWAVRASREPGATNLGTSLRDLLLSGETTPAPWTEAFLFEADRAQTYAEVLRPALEEGAVVVSDRGPFGTVAYQGFGRGLAVGLIDEMSAAAWAGLTPDLTFVVDVEPRLGLSRKTGASEHDRFDEEDLAFTSRVRDGYLFSASRHDETAVLVDGSQPITSAFESVRAATEQRLADRLRTAASTPRS